MEFIQIIEFTTTRLDEVEALMDEWVKRTEGKRKAHRGTVTADRDQADTFVQIVEFPSYDDAMSNSSLPETSDFAEQIAKLCDGPLKFRNLDVRRVDDFG
jgi:quinol monooxygenase YgiN